MTIKMEAATSAKFTPFGALIEAPKLFGERSGYTDWLGSARPGMSPRLHTNLVAPTSLPYAVTLLERHPYSAQIFVPLDVERYLVAVAPSLEGGAPDLAGLRVFVVPGNVGIVYQPGVWHAGATVLERRGSFAVLMWRNDTADDEEFLPLTAPIHIVE